MTDIRLLRTGLRQALHRVSPGTGRVAEPRRRARHSLLAVVAMSLALVLGVASSGHAEDRHEEYYYPSPVTSETYVSRAQIMPEAERATRLGFVTGLTQQLLSRPYPPGYVIFAKGNEAEKMIIVAVGDNGFRTLYQARALLAELTAVARSTSLLQELAVEDIFTFFDLARLLGFEQITISNGVDFSHQIELD
ncbi:molybdopterin-guanine dinucleotide biosynthesis protein A [Marinibaculum pumilum]|uniref:Molybdopterin-guanine dinucleotide biosynthesis protein A n=1 Tax=Marinibaculum pumilum TaxID=1766165 RepID=A0ABV7L443_9PROT